MKTDAATNEDIIFQFRNNGLEATCLKFSRNFTLQHIIGNIRFGKYRRAPCFVTD